MAVETQGLRGENSRAARRKLRGCAAETPGLRGENCGAAREKASPGAEKQLREAHDA